MSLCRHISLIGLLLLAAGSVTAAAPAKKKAAPAAKPPKPETAKPADSPVKPDPAKPAGPANPNPAKATDPPDAAGPKTAGGEADAAATPAPPPEPPPDMQGTAETPEEPHLTGTEPVPVVTPKAVKPNGYPTEEVLRPITLPARMSEVSIAPHAQVSPFTGSDAIRARHGITSNIQIGLTYLYLGIYDRNSVDPGESSKVGVHSGKAFGFDVTVRLQDWLAVKAGVPMYGGPFAASLALGVPVKFTFGDKFAIGGLDDLVDIKLYRFAPSYYQDVANARGALVVSNGTQQSRGHLRLSGYGIYQHSPRLAVIGRLGVDNDLGLASDGPAGTSSGGGTVTFIRAGVLYAVRSYFDAGFSLGWDSLATAGSFGPQLSLALRI